MCNTLFSHACRQENYFEWKLWTNSCSMDWKEWGPNLIWLVNWIWRDSSIIPSMGQQDSLVTKVDQSGTCCVKVTTNFLMKWLDILIVTFNGDVFEVWSSYNRKVIKESSMKNVGRNQRQSYDPSKFRLQNVLCVKEFQLTNRPRCKLL